MFELNSKAKGLFSQVFPERQIYHRSGGTVRYISIAPWQQALLAAGAVAAIGWTGFATYSVLSQNSYFVAGGTALDRNTAKYQRWLQETRAREASALSLLEERTLAFERATEEFEVRHQTLKVLLNALNNPDSIETAALKGNGASVLVDASIDESAARQSRPTQLASASIEVAGFRAKVDSLRGEQTVFLDQAEELAVEKTERAQGVIRLAGVDVGRFDQNANRGGPLVEVAALNLAEAASQDSDAFSRRVASVAARLEEANYFESILDAMPLREPVDTEFRFTSGYGTRRDPVTFRQAWHGGLDMAAFRKAPIVASAPGKVVGAGWKGAYGNYVEIEHGYGFKTRYGHLHSITVKRGDTVAMGDLIGRMGSTGRSTGTHLHYEVWFHGKTYDPMNFLRAGKHVYEK